MIITSSTLTQSSQHSASSSTQVSENLRAWVGKANVSATEQGTTISISAAGLAASSAELLAGASAGMATGTPASPAGSLTAAQPVDAGAVGDSHTSAMKLIIEMLTGHRIQLYSGNSAAQSAGASSNAPATATPAMTTPTTGAGIEYNRQRVHTESEQTTFQSSGSVQTADGRSIVFQLGLTMSSSYSESSSTSVRAGDAVQKDPLMVNFGGTAAQLQNQSFSFDLQGNGQTVKVALPGSGSGFLALDANGNGKIDSGAELFGTKSGNGFADLARYDKNGNGWIDAADPVFNQLRVWTPSTSGGGTLASLPQVGIAAISLTSTATPFEIKNSSNQSLGSVVASSVTLAENGSAGSLQQVNLTVG